MRDDESKPHGTEEKNDRSSESFTKMLDISEHSTAIEMKFDHHHEQSDGGNAPSSNIFNSLEEFRNEYKQYLDSNVFTDIITRNIGNLVPGNKTPDLVGSHTTTKLNHAPQPLLDDIEDRRSIKDRSLSMPRSRKTISEVDTRDDSMQHTHGKQQRFRDTSLPQLRDLSLSLSQHNVSSSIESDDYSSSKDASGRSSSGSERSRILRKKMSDLLEIKNSIKIKSSPVMTTADTQHNHRRVAKQQPHDDTATATATTSPGAPWRLAPNNHPKLYKF